VTRSILAIVTMSAIATAACGGGEARPEAASLPPAPPATANAPASEVTTPAAAPREYAPAPRENAASRPARASRPAPARETASTPRETSRPSRPTSYSSRAAANVPEYEEITVPSGALLALELRSSIGSDVSQVEDSVRALLRKPLVVDGREVLPKGTEVVGTVVDAERAGRVKGRSKIAFQFTSLRYDSEAYRLRTEPIERMGEATKGEDATKIGVGAGAGAVIGGLLGGGKGAAKGAAIGAAAGTGVVMATRGEEVRLEPGEAVDAKLTSPLAIRVRLR